MKFNQIHLLCIAAALALAACKNTEVPLNSQVQLPQAFTQDAAAKGDADIGAWWQQWNDPVLSGLIAQGLAQGHDVKIAVSRLNEARAVAGAARADLGPTVGLSGKAGANDSKMDNPLDSNARALLSRYPQASSLNGDTIESTGTSMYGGLTASWEPDIFGKKRSDADAARYAALGQQELAYGAQMLVAGDIADNYFKARAAQGRLKTADQTVATLRRMVRYIEGRFKAGHVSGYEVNEAKVQLTSAEAKRATIAAEYAAYVRSIAVLTGNVPQTFTLPESSVDVLARQPSTPGGQTPQGLLERRPDLRAQAAQVNAYAAKFASAKADLLPRFTISFMGQGGRIGVDGDRSLTGWASLLSVGIQTPLFTNGRIKANIKAADARLQTALLEYDKRLLTALGEVDSAYQGVESLSRQTELLQTAHNQAARHAADTEKMFRNGYKTLDVALKAHIAEGQMQENLIAARLARAQMLVSLYKALGGGWSAK